MNVYDCYHYTVTAILIYINDTLLININCLKRKINMVFWISFKKKKHVPSFNIKTHIDENNLHLIIQGEYICKGRSLQF